MIDERATDVAALRDRAGRYLRHRLEVAEGDLRHTLARVRAVSPAATMHRGYAIVQRADGHVVRAASEVAAGDPVRVRLAEGELAATVTATATPDTATPDTATPDTATPDTATPDTASGR
jgi:exodeoxyribonuclease VII large subunit